MLKTSKPRSKTLQAVLSDDDLLCHLRPAIVWDSFRLGPDLSYESRLFGSANVGNLHLTNMQVPGGIPGELHFIVMHWSARHNATGPLGHDLVAQAAHGTYITLTVNSAHVATYPLALLMSATGARPPQWPIVIQARESFDVRVSAFRHATTVATRFGDNPPHIWIQLEGVYVPRDLYSTWHLSNDPEEIREEMRRWRVLQSRILRILTSDRSRAVDTAEHIARWVSSTADETVTDDVRASLHALADGIRERFVKENA